MRIVDSSIRSMRMSAMMRTNQNMTEQASPPAGSVFRNLMNAPPPPPPPPPVTREHEPVRPSVEPLQAGVEPATAPTVESRIEPVRYGVKPGVQMHEPPVPGKSRSATPMFTADDLRRNFVMTEILGKPLALRRR